MQVGTERLCVLSLQHRLPVMTCELLSACIPVQNDSGVSVAIPALMLFVQVCIARIDSSCLTIVRLCDLARLVVESVIVNVLSINISDAFFACALVSCSWWVALLCLCPSELQLLMFLPQGILFIDNLGLFRCMPCLRPRPFSSFSSALCHFLWLLSSH